MNPNTRIEMAHPIPPTPDASGDRQPMAKPKETVRRRFAKIVARMGLITAVGAGGAGVVHHVNPNIELGGPIPVGAAADTVGSAAVEGLVKLANSEPQLAQEDLAQNKAEVEDNFKPKFGRVNGQIEIDLSKLSDVKTKQGMLAMLDIRLADTTEPIDASKIKTLDGKPAVPGLILTVDNPTVADLTGKGMGIFYTGTIDTGTGTEPVLFPESSVTVTRQGELTPLASITDPNVLNSLDVVHQISPVPAQ